MKKILLLIFLPLLLSKIVAGQLQVVDNCFMSCTPMTSFNPSPDLVSFNADLIEWTGTNWIGFWPSANLTIPPPSGQNSNCRAIFIGSGTLWTTNGEGFSMRLNQPLVTGQTYTMSFTYVSHGLGSDGHFNPKVYTNFSASFTGEYIDTLPGVGYSWTTNNFTFTATPTQNGHQWMTVRTVAETSTGLVHSFCVKCEIPTGIVATNQMKTAVDVFPNPFSNLLNIRIQKQEAMQILISIKNTLGQHVFRTEENNPGSEYKTAIDLNELPGGIYFVEIIIDGERTIKKISKE